MFLRKTTAVIGLLIVMLTIMLPPSIWAGRVMSLFGIFAIVYPIVKSLKTSDYHITIIFVFMFSYMLVAFNYFWLGKHIILNDQCESLATVYRVLQVLCVFHLILLYSLKYSRLDIQKQRPVIENNSSIFYFLVFISFVLITFGQTGSSIFDSGSYRETIESSNTSTIYGYSVIPITLSLIYANTKKKLNISYIIIAYFALKNLAFGGRIDTVQLLIAVFFIRFQYFWSKRKLFMFVSAGSLFITFWGVYRMGIDADNIGVIIDATKEYLLPDGSIDYQIGNAPEVYYSSIRMIYFINNEILDWSLRLYSFLYFILSVVTPYSMLPDVANLSAYMQDSYYSGGGGLAPVFFYVFAGWIGVIAFSWFIPYCINLYTRQRVSKYVRYYVILLLATTPRWYAYYPIQILKFCVVGALMYYFLILIGRNTLKNRNKTSKSFKTR